MPGMDGLEALPLIRDLAPDTSVVVLSGFSAERMAAVALAHGASHYVEKGVNLAELRRVVRDCKRIAEEALP
jgi:DNA-binding NarL/FixJ family response regulator